MFSGKYIFFKKKALKIPLFPYGFLKVLLLATTLSGFINISKSIQFLETQ